jgi:hypothetical protein
MGYRESAGNSMTAKEFIRAVANGESDPIQVLLDILDKAGLEYCLIGGLAVNAYAEPLVSLDLDLVVVDRSINAVCELARRNGMRVEQFTNSVDSTSPTSDLRIQFQTAERYQAFIPRARRRKVLGYEMAVARAEDVLQGKIWAYQYEIRRKSKRQKDLADILRLIEAHPALRAQVPEEILQKAG